MRYAVDSSGWTLVFAAIAGATRLYASSDPTSWFPADHPYRMAAELVNDRFGGTQAIELVADTGREDGLKDPSVLARLEDVDALVGTYRDSGARLSYSNSLVDIVKETHQALNANDASKRSGLSFLSARALLDSPFFKR